MYDASIRISREKSRGIYTVGAPVQGWNFTADWVLIYFARESERLYNYLRVLGKAHSWNTIRSWWLIENCVELIVKWFTNWLKNWWKYFCLRVIKITLKPNTICEFFGFQIRIDDDGISAEWNGYFIVFKKLRQSYIPNEDVELANFNWICRVWRILPPVSILNEFQWNSSFFDRNLHPVSFYYFRFFSFGKLITYMINTQYPETTVNSKRHLNQQLFDTYTFDFIDTYDWTSTSFSPINDVKSSLNSSGTHKSKISIGKLLVRNSTWLI